MPNTHFDAEQMVGTSGAVRGYVVIVD